MGLRKVTSSLDFYMEDLANCEDALRKDVTNFNFSDDTFKDHLNNEFHENNQNIRRMLLHLATCHTVVIDFKEDKQFYNASSPDELALVNAAKYFDYTFNGRDEENNIEIDIKREVSKLTLLNVIEFTSLR